MSNRKVSTDALETLGTIIGENEKRDAIHLAVIPMLAVERLYAGQDVGLVEGGASTIARDKLGIVDPFLKVAVQPGQRFWLVLYPRMVTSLRHVWSHPAFADESLNPDVIEGVLTKARRDVQRLADEAGISFEEMMRFAKEFVEEAHYAVDGGRWQGISAGDEFWNAYEIVAGVKVDEESRGSIFTCTC